MKLTLDRRNAILNLLKSGEKTSTEIGVATKQLTQSVVYQLKDLQAEGLIECYRDVYTRKMIWRLAAEKEPVPCADMILEAIRKNTEEIQKLREEMEQMKSKPTEVQEA